MSGAGDDHQCRRYRQIQISGVKITKTQVNDTYTVDTLAATLQLIHCRRQTDTYRHNFQLLEGRKGSRRSERRCAWSCGIAVEEAELHVTAGEESEN